MINRSFYLSHEQVEKKKQTNEKKKKKKRKHDKIIHTLREKEIRYHISHRRLIVNFAFMEE